MEIAFLTTSPYDPLMHSKKQSSAEDSAKSWGIDVSLLEANLQRTPEERLEVLQQALDTIFELRKAWDHVQGKIDPPKTTGK